MKKGMPLDLQFFAEEDAAAVDTAAKNAAQEEETRPDAAGQEEMKEAETGVKSEADIARLVAEEVKKASMSGEERKAYDADQREKALQAREEAIAMRELQAEAKVLLAENSLPESFLGMVLGKDRADTEARIRALKDGFDGAVQQQVGQRLKGRTPSTGTGVTGQSETEILQATVESYL